MKRRIRRLAQQWATAANRLDAKLEQQWRDQKKVSLFALIITAFSFNRSIIQVAFEAVQQPFMTEAVCE